MLWMPLFVEATCKSRLSYEVPSPSLSESHDNSCKIQ